MGKSKKILLSVLGLVIAVALWDSWIFYIMTPTWEPLLKSQSPNGRYTASVYYNPGLLKLPPSLNPRGTAGTVILQENKTGRILHRVVIGSTNNDESIIEWSHDGNWVLIQPDVIINLPTKDSAK